MANQSVALECLWGAGVRRVCGNELLSANSPSRQISMCLNAAYWSNYRSRCNAIARSALPCSNSAARPRLLRYRGLSIRSATASGASSELFSDEVGLTPKLFSRVSRFQQVIQTAHALDDINWTQSRSIAATTIRRTSFTISNRLQASRLPSTWRGKRRMSITCRWTKVKFLQDVTSPGASLSHLARFQRRRGYCDPISKRSPNLWQSNRFLTDINRYAVSHR